jgi:hypothetical protein
MCGGGNNQPMWNFGMTTYLGSAKARTDLDNLLALFEQQLSGSLREFGQKLETTRKQNEGNRNS